MGVLDTNLFMIEEVPRPEVVGYFGACDLAISTVVDNPALRANSANKIFDGWAAGRPVAVNHEGWLADVIRASGAGLVLPAGDPTAAARSAGALLRDPDRVRAARAAAVRLASEEYDRDLLFQRFEEALLAAVDRPGKMRDKPQRMTFRLDTYESTVPTTADTTRQSVWTIPPGSRRCSSALPVQPPPEFSEHTRKSHDTGRCCSSSTSPPGSPASSRRPGPGTSST